MHVPRNSLAGLLSVTRVVPAKSLAYLLQLGLNVLRVYKTKLRPDSTVEEQVSLVPRPHGGRNGGLSCESRCCTIALLHIGLDKHITRQKQVVVCLQGVCPSNVIIWCNSGRDLFDMRRQILIILDLGKGLILDQLGLDIILPPGLAESLGLRDAGAAVLGGVGPCGCQNPLVDRVVVWAG